jgi:hypothetical protein
MQNVLANEQFAKEIRLAMGKHAGRAESAAENCRFMNSRLRFVSDEPGHHASNAFE